MVCCYKKLRGGVDWWGGVLMVVVVENASTVIISSRVVHIDFLPRDVIAQMSLGKNKVSFGNCRVMIGVLLSSLRPETGSG